MNVISDPLKTPDIIIADYSLPGSFNGAEAISKISDVLGYHVPAFIITGEADTSKVRKIADHGYRVLSKPVHPAKVESFNVTFIGRIIRFFTV